LTNWQYTNRAIRRAAEYSNSAHLSLTGVYDARYIQACGIHITDTCAANRSAWFDLANGVAGSKGSSVTFQTITPIGNGWYRCSITVTTAAVSETATITMVTGDAADDGTNGTTVDLWGAQLELASMPTSYIVTTTATVTRSADIVFVPVASFPLNTVAHTLIAEGECLDPQTAAFRELASLFFSSTMAVYVARHLTYVKTTVNNTSLQTDMILEAVRTVGRTNRFAVASEANNFAASINGEAVVTDSAGSMPATTPTGLYVGATGTAQLNGHIRKLIYLPRRAADSELPRMSALAA